MPFLQNPMKLYGETYVNNNISSRFSSSRKFFSNIFRLIKIIIAFYFVNESNKRSQAEER